MNTKFYKVTDSALLPAIKKQLAMRHEIIKKFEQLRVKHNAAFYEFSDSIVFGLRFIGLRFEKPADFDHGLFKFTISRKGSNSDYLCRPRKANKKFYNEFMSGVTEFDYKLLLDLLFGGLRANIGFSNKNPNAFYFSVKGVIPTCHCIEVTATEYEQSGLKQEGE